MTFTLTGVTQTITNMIAIEKTVDELSQEQLKLTAREVATESKRQCPTKYSMLRKSQQISDVYSKGSEHYIDISYDTPYALRQHEEMSYYHPTPGTKAKYLEDPVMAYSGKFAEQINRALVGWLATGAKLKVF